MEYAQVNEAGTDAAQVVAYGNVAWDFTHFCPASALTPEEAATFRVVPLLDTQPPSCDPITHYVLRDGCELIDGQWQYAWTIKDYTQAQIDVHRAERATDLRASIVSATQACLDTWATTRNYDGILSACTYATSGVPRFAAEGQAAASARDATWAQLYDILAEVGAGKRIAPNSFADIEAELPVLEWPA